VEDIRFDDMAKALGSRKTRRLTLGAVLGGALSALGLADADDAAAKRKRCDQCEKRKCRRTNSGKKRCRCKDKANGTFCSIPGATSATCQSGTCVAAGGGGGGGCPVCQALQGTTCVNVAAGTACNGTGKCNGSGTCISPPNCTPKDGFCLKLQGTACCSRVCQGGNVTSGTCAQSQLGEPCITNEDCRTGQPILRFCGNNFTCQSVLNP
jgi:hypothetical protein